jgi:peptidoglycan/LPS O-acetylase OafA/YrhL
MSAEISTTQKTERIHAIDGLRGYAALMVIFYHSLLIFIDKRPVGHRVGDVLTSSTWSASFPDILLKFLLSLINGQTAVMLFFGISGAVLFRSLKADTASDWLKLPFVFTAKRVVRIYPALIVCLFVFFLINQFVNTLAPATYPAIPIIDVIKNATLYQITLHGASWTLQVEMIAIPFLLLAFALKRWLGIAALFMLLGYSLMVREVSAMGLGSASAYLWMPCFTIGMLAANLYESKAVIESTSKFKWAIFLFLFIFLMTLASPFYLTPFILQIGALFFVITHVMGKEQSALNKFLSLGISQYLGKISYSLYLWNVPLLYIIAYYISGITVSDYYITLGMLTGLVLAAITIPIAHISERYLERIKLPSARKAAPETVTI